MLEQSHKKLARALKGVTLVHDGRTAEVLAAQGFNSRENEGHPYNPVLTMKPGEFFCPKFRGGLLLLIASLDGSKPGGCVLVRKVRINGTIVNGPGRVCEALGFDSPVNKGKIRVKGEELVMRVLS